MFSFAVKYLGFMKHVPLAPQVFDGILKVHYFLFHRQVINYIDDIEETVSRWPGVTLSLHRYGGLQINYHGKELGHIHSNGLTDILFNKKIKEELIAAGRAQQHHVFKNSGWISVYIKTEADKKNVLELLELSRKS